MKTATMIVLGIFLLSAAPLGASSSDPKHHDHGSMAMDQGQMPQESGQSAFAAISEIVQLLRQDSGTDWSKVKLDALRTHLIDMNELTLNANVKQTEEPGAVVFAVSGTGRATQAIQRMVPAHAMVLNTTAIWKASTEITQTGVELRIASEDPEELAVIAALGFFGVMATGAHHQEHHMAIARGEMAH